MDKPEDPVERESTHAWLVCPECGDIIDIKEVETLLLSIHQQNACPATRVIVGGDGD